jgi:Tol biopolymer transport system component
MRADRWGVLLVGACLSACNQEYPNPFENPNPTVTPPPGTALLLTSNLYGARPGAPREVYAASEDGSSLTRLTFCNNDAGRACDSAEATAGRTRTRIAVRRISADTNGDGALSAADGAALVYVDLTSGLEGSLVAASQRVSGLDWSPADELFVYSANSTGGLDDLFRMDVNGTNNRPLTQTVVATERRPRLDPTGSIAAYERIDETGVGQIWVFVNDSNQAPISEGGPPGDVLPGTPYRIGSDADPDFSPDARSLVFRRLTAPGNGGLGAWDLLSVSIDGGSPVTIVSGPRYRGAPDWGPRGIVFEEIDEAGLPSLVLVAPDGSNRRTLATAPAGVSLSFPRWLQ